jgi:hypothetical protein
MPDIFMLSRAKKRKICRRDLERCGRKLLSIMNEHNEVGQRRKGSGGLLKPQSGVISV